MLLLQAPSWAALGLTLIAGCLGAVLVADEHVSAVLAVPTPNGFDKASIQSRAAQLSPFLHL